MKYHPPPLSRSMVLIALCAFLTACKAPKAEPFEQYAASIATLRQGVESAIKTDAQESRKKFIDQATKDDATAGKWIEDHVRITLSKEEAFEYSLPKEPATFLQADAAAKALVEINDGFQKHANLLRDLAGSKVASDETIDKVAADINGHAKDFVDSLNAANSAMTTGATGPIEFSGQTQALVSTAAAELLRQYLIKKQSSLLNEAIEKSVEDVKNYAEQVQVLIELVCEGERQRFSNRAKVIGDTLATGSKDDQHRRQLVTQMIQLNEEIIDSLDHLRAMHDAYGRIPDAFRSLTKAAGGKPGSLLDLQSLSTDARRAYKRYATLRKANEAE